MPVILLSETKKVEPRMDSDEHGLGWGTAKRKLSKSVLAACEANCLTCAERVDTLRAKAKIETK
jgi:hypothetical protein